MSLTAQTVSTFLGTFALCLAIQFPAAQVKPAGSTIRGVVTYSDTGRPVRYTRVIAFRNEGSSSSAGAITNRRGEFEIEALPAGRYVLMVEAPGILRPDSSAGSGGPVIAQLRLAGALFTDVVVNGTDSVEVNVQAVRGGVITGRVVTEDEQPVANADVNLLKRENGRWLPLDLSSSRLSSATPIKTDPSGSYRVAGLVAGEYLVRVSEDKVAYDGISQEDGAYSDGFLMAAYHPAATSINDAQTVPVIEGSESTGIDIRVPERPAHTISGTLTFGKDKKPAGFVEVSIDRTDEIEFARREASATTRADDNGRWELRGVPAGEYSIRFSGSAMVEGIASGHFVIAPKRISVRVQHDDVVVPDTEVSTGGSINGRVNLDGKPPQKFLYVQAIPEKQTSTGAVNDRRSLSWLTGDLSPGYMRPNGAFWIGGLPPGKYAITVSQSEGEQYYVKAITRKGVDLTDSTLRVKDESVIEDVVISLSSAFSAVEGQITQPGDSAKKTDFREAVVILAPANDATRRVNRGLSSAQPDEQGKFVISCPPGEYFLTALTSAEIRKIPKPISEDYFREKKQKFERVKVKASEKLKGLTVLVGSK